MIDGDGHIFCSGVFHDIVKDLFVQEKDVPSDIQQREIIPNNFIMLENGYRIPRS
jgi:hypothetical protein